MELTFKKEGYPAFLSGFPDQKCYDLFPSKGIKGTKQPIRSWMLLRKEWGEGLCGNCAGIDSIDWGSYKEPLRDLRNTPPHKQSRMDDENDEGVDFQDKEITP